MNITIVGGGNIGTQTAVHCAEKGHAVTIYTSTPALFKTNLSIWNEDCGQLYTAPIKTATDDPQNAFSDAELIFITVPAFCMESTAKKILPHIRPRTMICLVPGTGGGECCFKDALMKDCTLIGLQRVPAVARLIRRGERVCVKGYRKSLHCAAIPDKQTGLCADILADIFDMPCNTLPCYLNVTLTPSNPLLHTSRLYSLFSSYSDGIVYSHVPLFYEEWDQAASDLLLSLDDELQLLCGKLSDFDLTAVRTLKEHYESKNAEELTRKLRSINSLKGLTSPVVSVKDGYVPDFESRYFKSDFPYGLKLLTEIAQMVGCDVPQMRKLMSWYQKISHNKHSFRYSDYGIRTYQDLFCFYSA